MSAAMCAPGRTRRCASALCVLAAWVPGPCAAEGEAEPAPAMTANGSLRAAWWSGSRSLDDVSDIAVGSVWLKLSVDLGAAGTVKADGWVAAQSRDEPRSHPSGRLRELYWRQSAGSLDVRLGSQWILWGRADAINPTDYLAPRDFTLLMIEDNEQRFGNLAANAVYHWREYSAQAVWIPKIHSHVIPLPPRPGVTYASIDPARRDNWALKLDRTGGGLDGSLSYYEGDDPLPDLAIGGLTASGLQARLANHRTRMAGADFSATVGPYVLRGEAAWTRPADAGSERFDRKRPQFFGVIGGERAFGETFNVNLQYFAQRVAGFRSPDTIPDPIAQAVAWQQAQVSNQTSSFQHGMTLRLAWRWANDTWQAETSGVYSFTSSAHVWRARLEHAFDDHWRMSVGFDRFGGPEHTLFGMLKDNSTVCGELRYSF
jgi:hypothetical protein